MPLSNQKSSLNTQPLKKYTMPDFVLLQVQSCDCGVHELCIW
uniref:Uncharacterized protein n=1 Tax=Anguilla anguilla TaxID=7936 RepID=A0A0E9TPV0_ANGAN